MTPWKLPVSAAVFGAMALFAAADTVAEQAQPRGRDHPQLAQASPDTPSSAASAVTPAASWHTLTGPDSSFRAEMPAAPSYTTREMLSAAGSSYTLHQYLLEQADVSWVAQTAVYPEDVKVSNQRTNLQGGLDNAAKNMEGGKWASIGWVTLQGVYRRGCGRRARKPRHPLIFGHEGTPDLHAHLCGPFGLGAGSRRRPVHCLPAYRPIVPAVLMGHRPPRRHGRQLCLAKKIGRW